MKKIFFCAAMTLTAVSICSCDKISSLFGSKDKTEQTKDEAVEAVETKEEAKEEAAPKPEVIDVTMSGAVGKYPIVMSLHIDEAGKLTGAYYYKKSGPGNCLYVIGRKKGDHITINEFDVNGTNTGSFDGTFRNGELRGTMEAKSGHYDFVVNVDDTAVPAPYDNVDFGMFYMPDETYTNAGYTGGDDYSASDANNWDSVLDEYERYVDRYISLLKKAQAGDMSALADYPDVLKEAERLGKKLEGAEGMLTAAQQQRYIKILNKIQRAM